MLLIYSLKTFGVSKLKKTRPFQLLHYDSNYENHTFFIPKSELEVAANEQN